MALSLKMQAVLAALGIVVLQAIITVAIVITSAHHGCIRDMQQTIALRNIVQRSSQSLPAYRDQGLITTAQLNAALQNNARALVELKVPSC